MSIKKKKKFKNVHNSLVFKSPKLEITKMYPDRGVDNIIDWSFIDIVVNNKKKNKHNFLKSVDQKKSDKF